MTEKEIEPKKTIWAHHDADGIIAGYFTQIALGSDWVIQFPDKFGDTSQFKDGDVMVDMKPDNPNIKGLVIDHHFPHPDKRSYTLEPNISEDQFKNISSVAPASLLAWNKYKNSIPKKEWWKLVIGLAGDGQLELTPPEIFKLTPCLLREVKTSSYSSRYDSGRLTINTFPIFKLLSSYINSFLRKGDYESALNLIKYADSPYTIASSQDAQIAKEEIKQEFNTAVKDSQVYNYNGLSVVVFYSKYRMSGYIASSLQEILGKTVLAINERDGSLSLRGDLASYYREILKPIKYLELGGHAGFMGGNLKKNYATLLADLEEFKL